MVQGLSSSSPLYTLVPRVLQDKVGQEILGAALRTHPQLLEAYHMTKTGNATAMQDLDTDHIRAQGWKIEKLVVTAEEQDLEPQSIQKVHEIMRECRNDVHRIHVLDWAAYAMGTKRGLQLTANTGPSLFIDDSRYTVSSAPAAVLTTKKHTQYAINTCAIF